MDPILRVVSNVNKLITSVDPFDKGELADYFAKVGEDFGFEVRKNVRKSGFSFLCVWRDRGKNYLSVNASFGNRNELLGAIVSHSVLSPHLGVTIAASGPFESITDLVYVLRGLRLPFHTLIMDVKKGNVVRV